VADAAKEVDRLTKDLEKTRQVCITIINTIIHNDNNNLHLYLTTPIYSMPYNIYIPLLQMHDNAMGGLKAELTNDEGKIVQVGVICHMSYVICHMSYICFTIIDTIICIHHILTNYTYCIRRLLIIHIHTYTLYTFTIHYTLCRCHMPCHVICMYVCMYVTCIYTYSIQY
jgi:hypothetical protein